MYFTTLTAFLMIVSQVKHTIQVGYNTLQPIILIIHVRLVIRLDDNEEIECLCYYRYTAITVCRIYIVSRLNCRVVRYCVCHEVVIISLCVQNLVLIWFSSSSDNDSNISMIVSSRICTLWSLWIFLNSEFQLYIILL